MKNFERETAGDLVSNLDSCITGSHQPHRPVANHLRPCPKLLDVVPALEPCPIKKEGNHRKHNLKRKFDHLIHKSSTVSRQPNGPGNRAQGHRIETFVVGDERVAPNKKLPAVLRAKISPQSYSNRPPNHSGNRTFKEQVLGSFNLLAEGTHRVPWPFSMPHHLPS